MTDALTQTTSDPTIEDADALVVASAENLIEAIRIYTLRKLTQPEIKERVSQLGFDVSLRTIQNRVKGLRKEGQLPAVEPSQKTEAVRKRRLRESGTSRKTCGMSQPTQPTTTTIDDLPHHPAPTPQQQCVQADGWGDATVVTAEVCTMPDGEQDYQRAIQLFDEIIALSKRNFASGWTELQWNELGGYCRTFEGCCNARGRRNGSVAKKPVPSAPAFKPCLN